MAEPTYSLATEQDVAFLCETYRENIASLHAHCIARPDLRGDRHWQNAKK